MMEVGVGMGRGGGGGEVGMGSGGRPGKKEPEEVRAAVKAWQSW